MHDAPPFPERLNEAVRTVALAASAPDTFGALLESSRLATPRAALFLARRGRIRGWSSFGYAADTALRQQEFTCAVGEGRLGRLVTSSADGVVGQAAGHADQPPQGADPDFGQPLADQSTGLPVRVQGRPIAVLLAERSGDESPWSPAVMQRSDARR